MRNFFLLFLLLSSLFLIAGPLAISQVQGQTQNTYLLEIQGVAWHHTELKILLITPNNETWWNPIYVNSTVRAIGQWNEAIQYYASNNTDYQYLSLVKLEPTVSNQSLPGFDIYLNWTQNSLENSADVVGLTTLLTLNNFIINGTLNLATHTGHGEPLADGDAQNIVLHELGHVLGLGHSNDTGDVMYPVYNLYGSARSISTLDAYGVATTFAWVTNQTDFYPINEWLSNAPVLSPSSQNYYLPVSAQNARPQTLQNNSIVQTLVLAFEILVHPEILVFVVLFFIVIIIAALLPRRKREDKVDS